MIPVAINNNSPKAPFAGCKRKASFGYFDKAKPETADSYIFSQTYRTSSDTFSQTFEKTIKVKDKYIVIVSASLYLIGYIIDNWGTIINALVHYASQL